MFLIFGRQLTSYRFDLLLLPLAFLSLSIMSMVSVETQKALLVSLEGRFFQIVLQRKHYIKFCFLLNYLQLENNTYM